MMETAPGEEKMYIVSEGYYIHPEERERDRGPAQCGVSAWWEVWQQMGTLDASDLASLG